MFQDTEDCDDSHIGISANFPVVLGSSGRRILQHLKEFRDHQTVGTPTLRHFEQLVGVPQTATREAIVPDADAIPVVQTTQKIWRASSCSTVDPTEDPED